MSSPNLDALYIGLLALACAVGVGGCAAFVARRKHFPLNGRETSLVLFMEINIIVAAFDRMITLLGANSCIYIILMGQMQDLVLTNITLVRVFRLWFKYFASREQLKVHRLDRKRRRTDRLDRLESSCTIASSLMSEPTTCTNADTRSQNADTKSQIAIAAEPERSRRHSASASASSRLWFSRRAYLGRTAFLWKAFLGLTAVCIAIQMTIVLTTPSAPSGCPGADRAQNYVTFVKIPYLVVLLVFGYQLRSNHDGYYIKDEMKYLAVLLVALTCAILTEGALANSMPKDHFAFIVMSMVIYGCLIVAAVIATFLPVKWSFDRTSIAKPGRRQRLRSIFEAISDQDQVPPTSPPTDPPAKGKLKSTDGGGKGEGFSPLMNFLASMDTTLREILTDDAYHSERRSFESHIAREFSVENVMFFDAVVAFREEVGASTSVSTSTVPTSTPASCASSLSGTPPTMPDARSHSAAKSSSLTDPNQKSSCGSATSNTLPEPSTATRSHGAPVAERAESRGDLSVSSDDDDDVNKGTPKPNPKSPLDVDEKPKPPLDVDESSKCRATSFARSDESEIDGDESEVGDEIEIVGDESQIGDEPDSLSELESVSESESEKTPAGGDDVTTLLQRRRVMSDEEVAARAIRIYLRFVSSDAAFEVNLPHSEKVAIANILSSNVARLQRTLKRLSVRKLDAYIASCESVSSTCEDTDDRASAASRAVSSVLHTSGRIPASLFANAERHIYSLMAKDTFQRWRTLAKDELRPSIKSFRSSEGDICAASV